MMSEKKTAASTPWRRTGWSVISAASAGSRQTSSMLRPARSRSARYSGRLRPACRMNHTGVRSGRAPVSARSRAGATSAANSPEFGAESVMKTS